MAKLPKIEIKALWALDELHKGNRRKALQFLAEAGDGPIAEELRATTKKRGRQPFGRSHLWWEIGIDNEDLTQRGFGYETRLEKLGAEYMLHPRQIEDALSKYERAVEELRAIEASR